MKQAILITAYKEFDQLHELLHFFDDSFSIYIHIDKKCKLSNQDLEYLKADNIKLISQKYKVNWGGINHLKAYLHLAGEALSDSNNIYFHLITGQDLPVKSLNYLKSFPTEDSNLSKNFLRHTELPNKNWFYGGYDRLLYYHFNNLINSKKHKKYVQYILRIQKKLGFKRSIPRNFPKLYGGSTYWSLNRDALEYVFNYTKQNPKIFKRFSFTFCAEEIYFQTVLLNSPMANKIVNDDLRYINWKNRRVTPAFLDESDFEAILKGNYLFARKFNEKSNYLKTLIANNIFNKK